MERVLAQVLFTFAIGLFLIGLVVGLLTANSGDFCGAVLSHGDGCRQPVSLLAMMLVSWGLALTCAIAGWVAIDAAPRPPAGRPGHED